MEALGHFFLHITGGDNGAGPFYLELSGFITYLIYIGALGTWYKNSRCHVDTCHKRAKFPFQHYKLCKLHHPDVPDNITHLHIKQLHKKMATLYEH